MWWLRRTPASAVMSEARWKVRIEKISSEPARASTGRSRS
jgi:hypothetical protein